jgi:hypothetical protein
LRSVAEYLVRAAEFDGMAEATEILALQKRYFDVAECYRLLARDRQRLVGVRNLVGAIRLHPLAAIRLHPEPTRNHCHARYDEAY